LERLTGDAGARALLAGATSIEAAPGELADIDTPEDLAALTTG
jgi:molybdenum cofactor cytidylyltransferase